MPCNQYWFLLKRLTTAKTYRIWDLPTRWFHWVNVLTVFLMLLTGFLFHFRYALAIDSREAKMALMVLHVCIGYAFATNLLVRIVWGFIGNPFARWASVLPSKETIRALREDVRDLVASRPSTYLGRSPLGRIAVTLMFLLLLTQAGTGLLQAGTRIYYPPFGSVVAHFVAKPGVGGAEVSWRNEKETTDPGRLQDVRTVQTAAAVTHKYSAYLLMLLIGLHITGVVLTETRQRSNAVSAMFSGRKTIASPPTDIKLTGSDDRLPG